MPTQWKIDTILNIWFTCIRMKLPCTFYPRTPIKSKIGGKKLFKVLKFYKRPFHKTYKKILPFQFHLALFRILWAKAPSPYYFFHVTSTNVGISFQNFLTFKFNPFATLMWNFKAIGSACPKLLKTFKVFFLVKSL